MLYEQKYRENVQRGIAYLNDNVPGWFNRIDLDILDLNSCSKCIKGQLDLPDSTFNTSLGFYIGWHQEDYPMDESEIDENVFLLQNLWRTEIENRLLTKV